jgi:hypothetical protein
VHTVSSIGRFTDLIPSIFSLYCNSKAEVAHHLATHGTGKETAMTKQEIFIRKVGFYICMMLVFAGIVPSAWCVTPEWDYDGMYAGDYVGDDSGVWVALIDSTGTSAFLSYSTVRREGEMGILQWQDDIEARIFETTTKINGTQIDFWIFHWQDFAVEGGWDNTTREEKGTLSGGPINSTSYDGTYSGTFAGDSSGKWAMTVHPDGHITGYMRSSAGTGNFEGVCHPEGYVFAFGMEGSGGEFAVFGTISGTSISGSWISESGDEGTFKTGGGDSGGCFIGSLIGN